jgi:hypothetical protein
MKEPKVQIPMYFVFTAELGRKYVRDLPWPLAAQCNTFTNKQTNFQPRHKTPDEEQVEYEQILASVPRLVYHYLQ